jgi:hypothetical protein
MWPVVGGGWRENSCCIQKYLCNRQDLLARTDYLFLLKRYTSCTIQPFCHSHRQFRETRHQQLKQRRLRIVGCIFAYLALPLAPTRTHGTTHRGHHTGTNTLVFDTHSPLRTRKGTAADNPCTLQSQGCTPRHRVQLPPPHRLCYHHVYHQRSNQQESRCCHCDHHPVSRHG